MSSVTLRVWNQLEELDTRWRISNCRMAQKRCRMKKKRWIMQLKRDTECVLSENQNLQVEVSSLRAEIAHLKTLLLAHRNCSVTRAMFKGMIAVCKFRKIWAGIWCTIYGPIHKSFCSYKATLSHWERDFSSFMNSAVGFPIIKWCYFRFILFLNGRVPDVLEIEEFRTSWSVNFEN